MSIDRKELRLDTHILYSRDKSFKEIEIGKKFSFLYVDTVFIKKTDTSGEAKMEDGSLQIVELGLLPQSPLVRPVIN
jgi:hypothetical protein